MELSNLLRDWGFMKAPPGPGSDKASAINDALRALETGFMHLIKSVCNSGLRGWGRRLRAGSPQGVMGGDPRGS